MPKYEIICPGRLRTIERPFAAIPCRFLMDGHFASLSAEGKQIYFLLMLAADRNGMSFYSKPRLQQHLNFSSEQLERGVVDLLNRDLIAYKDGAFQILSLPSAFCPSAPAKDIFPHASTQPLCRVSVSRPTNAKSPKQPPEEQYPEDVRQIMLKLIGRTSLF